MELEIKVCDSLKLETFDSCDRPIEQCIPEEIINGEIYRFIKYGQLVFNLKRNISLTENREGGTSNQVALVKILESTHYLEGDMPWTKGTYRIIKKLG